MTGYEQEKASSKGILGEAVRELPTEKLLCELIDIADEPDVKVRGQSIKEIMSELKARCRLANMQESSSERFARKYGRRIALASAASIPLAWIALGICANVAKGAEYISSGTDSVPTSISEIYTQQADPLPVFINIGKK